MFLLYLGIGIVKKLRAMRQKENKQIALEKIQNHKVSPIGGADSDPKEDKNKSGEKSELEMAARLNDIAKAVETV